MFRSLPDIALPMMLVLTSSFATSGAQAAEALTVRSPDGSVSVSFEIKANPQPQLVQTKDLMTLTSNEFHRARRNSHVGKEFHFGGPERMMVFSLASQAAYSVACLMSSASSSG